MSNLLFVRVRARTLLAENIAMFDLAPLDAVPLPTFDAGAHIDVHLPGGWVRQYSLVELPGDGYRICVSRHPQSRGGSAQFLAEVHEGDVLTVSPPRNHFELDPRPGPALLFARGIGITPILCMAEQLARQARPFRLHYSGRSRSRMAFIERIQERYGANVNIHADDEDTHRRFDPREAIGKPDEGQHLYVCGSNGYIDDVLDTARSLGWCEDTLHREHFAGASVDRSTDGPFELELRRSGFSVQVPAGLSAAQALLRAGVDLPLSCEQGVCGSCQSTVLAGIPDHRDMYLSEAERARNDSFMPCCSRSCTPTLVLDL